MIAYPNVNYHLQIQVPDKIALCSKDLIALLTVTLDSFCPYAEGIVLEIMIIADYDGIFFKFSGEFNNNYNILKENDYDYVYLKSIIDKYKGDIKIIRSKNFLCTIQIFY